MLPLVILLIAISVFIALKQSKPEKATITQPEKMWRVDSVPVVFKDISPEVTVYGRVETPRQASLNAAVNADVIAIKVLEGSEVDAGQLLIKLDDSDVAFLLEQRQADYAEIEALISSEQVRFKRDKSLLAHEKELVALAEKAVIRARKLEESKLVSRATLDDTFAAKQRQILTLKRLEHDIAEHPARLAGLKARLIRAKALVEQAKLDLARTTVTAPFTGRVAKLNVSVGDRVRVGDSLLSVYDLNDLEVRAQLPGRYLKQIRQSLDMKQQLTATAKVEGKPLQFKLSRLSGEIQQDSGGIDGLFQLDNGGQKLELGTFVELSIRLQAKQNVISIPFNALYGLDKVFRIKEGYLEAVKIERVGEHQTDRGDSHLLIRSQQLKQGDRLVSTQLPNAITGLRVETIND